MGVGIGMREFDIFQSVFQSINQSLQFEKRPVSRCTQRIERDRGSSSLDLKGEGNAWRESEFGIWHLPASD